MVARQMWCVAGVMAMMSSPSSSAAASQVSPAVSYESTFRELMDLAPSGRSAPVERLVLARDVGTFTLGPGTVVLLSPVAGRTVGVAYVGDGTFSFEPPSEVERAHLRRLLDVEVLEEPVKSVVFLFGDTTLAELESRLAFEERPPPGGRGKVADALKYFAEKQSSDVSRTALATFLNGVQNEYFYAHIEGAKHDPLIFQVDPYDRESIQLMRRPRGRRASDGPEIVNQFLSRAERERGTVLPPDVTDLVHVDGYVIDATIAKNLTFSATATLTITRRDTVHRWVPFSLFDRLEVDSASWEGSGPATFFKGEESSTLWVRFDPALEPGERRRLTLHYGGKRSHDLLYEKDAWYFLRTSTGWYPVHNRLAHADFDVTFRVPERLTVAAVGRKVSEEVRAGSRITRWVTARPLRNAGFNIGEFETFEIDYPGVPHTTVMMSKWGHRNLDTRFLTGAGMEKRVGGDVVSSVAYFTKAFGEPLSDRFYATEIPYGHGEAFRGIVHLSLLTFFDETIPVEAAELFRAHEIAHQWWAIGVDYATYRDRWLSEGLSHLSALLYLKNVARKDAKFEELLRQWREEILKQGDKAGPIALGHRVASSEAPQDYDLIVYKKGAWVANMLRGMLLDPKTLSDEPFLAMMREFYATYRGQKASTRDLRRVVERHMEMDMGWFFDQWVDGTAIPTYEFAYRSQPQSDGNVVIRLRVDQKDVPDDFQMIVPLLLEFGPDLSVRFQMVVRGPRTEVDLPPMQVEPTKIELAPSELVLARVKRVEW